jgi:LmbE family N-acetylglucosaminyl deacetylase
MLFSRYLLAFSAAFAGILQGQVNPPPINSNAAAAYESLLRLRTTATVLHTTAHPDDEDGGLLTWLTRAQGVRTGLFTLTRGEGGADLAGPELFDALGVVRTEELLAADRYYGVDQFFSRAADFGFSKTLEETLSHWGKEEILRDAVRVIRLYRPDVVISRFQGTPRDGHGNHQAAGVVTEEAFAAAADPQRFPEQFREGLRPWQAKKLYRNVRNDEKPTLKIDTGVYDPMLGASYRQIAGTGLSFQRSQGSGGRLVAPGPAISSLELLKTTMPPSTGAELSLFDSIDTSLRGLAALAPSLHLEIPLGEIERDVVNAIQEFDARDPARVVEPHIAPALRNLRALIQNVTNAQIDEDAKYDLLFRLRNKEDEFMRAGNLLLGLSLEALVDPPRAADSTNTDPPRPFSVAVPGQKFSITATLTNRSSVKLEEIAVDLIVRGHLDVSSTPIRTTSLGYGEQLKQPFEVKVQDDAEYTRPYWSRQNPYRDNIYHIDQPQFVNLPWAPPEITAAVTYRVGGVRFSISEPGRTSVTEPLVGEVRRLVMIAPAMSVEVMPHEGVMLVGRRNASIDMHTDVHTIVTSNADDHAETKVHLELPPGWASTPSEVSLHFEHEGEVQTADFRLTTLQSEAPVAGRTYSVRAVAQYEGKEYREGYQVVAHAGLEPRHLYRPATAELRAVDVKVAPQLKIGYILGVGDAVPEALEELGLKPQMLGATDLATGNLNAFDTIFVGIRASAVREDYKTYNRRLLDYVNNGGNLVVQYQTEEFDNNSYGPYSLHMGRGSERVSEEDAKVTILDPANQVFSTPNKITETDFAGWVEERGSKFLSKWDPKYKPLLESNDHGQDPQRGGMLQAHYGKGTFTFIAYSLYRQLPAGVPGAYRILANLASPSVKSR